MNKKPYYRQSAVMFLAAAISMLMIGVGILVDTVWIICVGVIPVIAGLAYVIITDRKIGKGKK